VKSLTFCDNTQILWTVRQTNSQDSRIGNDDVYTVIWFSAIFIFWVEML